MADSPIVIAAGKLVNLLRWTEPNTAGGYGFNHIEVALRDGQWEFTATDGKRLICFKVPPYDPLSYPRHNEPVPPPDTFFIRADAHLESMLAVDGISDVIIGQRDGALEISVSDRLAIRLPLITEARFPNWHKLLDPMWKRDPVGAIRPEFLRDLATVNLLTIEGVALTCPAKPTEAFTFKGEGFMGAIMPITLD